MKPRGRFAGYDTLSLRRDLVSGVVVGIIAIPLGMAFAIAAGVDPRYGLYTSIIAGFLISLLGGSRFQIGGPTGAFVPILLAIVLQYGYQDLLIAGFLAGILLVLMGLFRVGGLIRYIPRPVTVGFTAGIAVIIFFGQIPNFLGLRGIEKHESFIENVKELLVHIGTVNGYSVAVALIGLAAMLAASRWRPRLPSSLIGLAASGLAAVLWFHGRVATIGSAYGGIPRELPGIALPDFNWAHITHLLYPAFMIAMLGGIESLLSAVVADRMSGDRHNSNRELIGQGIANMVTPLFGGIPATGAIARTAANIRSGASGPVSGMIHSAAVLLVLLLLAPLASGIPLAGMAPILMIVAWNMSDRKEFAKVMKSKSGDSLVLVLTFLLTVFTDLTTAVLAGLAAAMLLFVIKTGGAVSVSKVLPDHAVSRGKVTPNPVHQGRNCPQVQIYTVDGSLFFGTASRYQQTIREAVRRQPKVLLLRMGKVPFMDTTAEQFLAETVKEVKKYGGLVLISGIHHLPYHMMNRSGLLEEIGPQHVFEHTGQAIHFALTRLEKSQCVGCTQYVFHECTALSRAQG
ncbi:sulfate permease [Cohnella pontilimi]|uniref:Sulfate permease n=1 Tax=Cohnella pontilimi TaxID=2564100 RepID=A0A4V5LSL0_9BACL|nr:sulfate permease [Cohnella pontilimi]TJY43529.1 sulfate permease [Cohnella pontilimi]